MTHDDLDNTHPMNPAPAPMPQPHKNVTTPKEENRTVFTLTHPVRTGFLVTLGVGIALVLFHVSAHVGQLLSWLLIALFIALGLDPVVRFFENRNVARPFGVIVTFLGMVAIATVFLSSLVPMLIEQIQSLANHVRPWSDEILQSDWFKALDQDWRISNRVEEELGKLFNNTDLWTNTASNVFVIGQSIGNIIFGTIIVLILSLYFLTALPVAKEWAYRLAPASQRPHVTRLAEQIARTVGNYVIGQIAVAALQGCVAFIMLTVAKAPYAVLIAFTAALLAFIPMIGGLIASVIVSLVCLTQGLPTALVILAIYIVYLQIEANWISPKIMAKAVNVPAAVAVIAVIAGGLLLGVLGALIAIPTAASIMLLIREIWLPRQADR